MASRYGAREAGTDGTDFKYRESVASQHTTSLAVKSRLKRYFFYNIVICLAQIILFVITTLELVTDAQKYQPAPYQALIALSAIATIFGFTALPRNRVGFIKIHNIVLVLFGIGGLVWGVVANFENMRELWEGNPIEELFGVPKVLLVYNAAVLILVLYMSTLFGTYKLLSVWNYRKSK